MKRLGTFLFLTVLLSTFGQKHRFSIKWGKDSIGELTALRIKKGHSETIKISSDSKFTVLLMDQEMTTDCISVFRHDSLNTNTSESVRNDDKEKVSTSFLNGSYFCLKEDKCFKLKERVKFTVSKLYFYEPKNILSIYSERHLTFCKISRVSEGRYKLELPNGNENFYSYQNGQLVEMYSKRMGFVLKFVKV